MIISDIKELRDENVEVYKNFLFPDDFEMLNRLNKELSTDYWILVRRL